MVNFQFLSSNIHSALRKKIIYRSYLVRLFHVHTLFGSLTIMFFFSHKNCCNKIIRIIQLFKLYDQHHKLVNQYDMTVFLLTSVMFSWSKICLKYQQSRLICNVTCLSYSQWGYFKWVQICITSGACRTVKNIIVGHLKCSWNGIE